MKTGSPQNKKVVGLLAVLGVLAAYSVYSNFFDTSNGTSPAASAPAASRAPLGARALTPVPHAARNASDEFHPVLHSKRPEDQIDPMSVDPALRTDLLAKLQEVPDAGSGRNLFQFSKQPPPKTQAELPKGPEPNIKPVIGPTPITVADRDKDAGPPPPPPMPPVSFKYYGFSTVRRNGKQTAFFLDGDDILVKAVGEIVKGHYRLVRIGRNNAVVEDTDSKRQATVPLAEEAQG